MGACLSACLRTDKWNKEGWEGGLIPHLMVLPICLFLVVHSLPAPRVLPVLSVRLNRAGLSSFSATVMMLGLEAYTITGVDGAKKGHKRVGQRT